ncbi:MAG TPA: HAMP domain-containing sensor histidine kinase [Ktedonobacterales bacterium]|nr:HAMP domain-containing sensor histidine kinase [Ktedonobacterales bacterium]
MTLTRRLLGRLSWPWLGRQAAATAPPFRATRRRLVAINLLVVSAILAVMAVAVYISDAHAIDQQLTQQLQMRATRDSTADVLALLVAPNGAPPALRGDAHESGELGEPYEPASPNVFAVGFDAHGTVIYDPGRIAALGIPDRTAALPVLAGRVPNTLVTVGAEPHEYRLYTVPLLSHGRIVGALQTGISLDARERQLHDLLLTLAAAGLAMVLLTGLASVFLAERALMPVRRAYERQRQFAAAASHELRTPLAYARSQAELVLTQLATDLPAADAPADREILAADVHEIIGEMDYMSRLVRDLLLLARDEGDQSALAWQSLDFASLVVGAVEAVRADARLHGVELRVEIHGEPPDGIRVWGDADRLRQLALILLDNAVRYTPTGGRVNVEARVRQSGSSLLGHHDHVELIVSDTGSGIAPEHIARIFTPFFRADPARSTTEEHRGAGLGLALAQWIVQAHGGKITVESTPGVGSTFRVVLASAGG